MSYNLDHITVLLVDDMRPMLELTKSILASFGFTKIVLAENGKEGFHKYCERKPDFIITDWQMNPVDGLEFTRLVRKHPQSPNPFTPIIMMTGFSSRLRVMKARDHGITEFLVKPFTAKDLYARVFQIIEKPRQFVSTEEFFGPDRRRKREKDYSGPRRRDDDSTPQTLENVTSDILKKLQEEAKNI
ncbi:MAG: response regulator [Alphaproteobacteria bacterium]|nr:response regulator [Alphaproteobacteria bacterium]